MRSCFSCGEKGELEYHSSEMWREKNLHGAHFCPKCHKAAHMREAKEEKRREKEAKELKEAKAINRIF